MTNAAKKRLNRKGFTLAEVLVTVAIILILAGVTFVSVVQYPEESPPDGDGWHREGNLHRRRIT